MPVYQLQLGLLRDDGVSVPKWLSYRMKGLSGNGDANKQKRLGTARGFLYTSNLLLPINKSVLITNSVFI